MDHSHLADVIERLLAPDGHAWPHRRAGDTQLLLEDPGPRRIALVHEGAIVRAPTASNNNAGGVEVDVPGFQVGAAAGGDEVDALRFVDLDGLGKGEARRKQPD